MRPRLRGVLVDGDSCGRPVRFEAAGTHRMVAAGRQRRIAALCAVVERREMPGRRAWCAGYAESDNCARRTGAGDPIGAAISARRSRWRRADGCLSKRQTRRVRHGRIEHVFARPLRPLQARSLQMVAEDTPLRCNPMADIPRRHRDKDTARFSPVTGIEPAGG